MSDGGNGEAWRGAGGAGRDGDEPASRGVFGAFWALLFVATFFVAAPWAGFHGVLLGCVGLLLLGCPPVVALPRLWWFLAAVFVLAGAAVFLPAGWFALPPWRQQLAALGVATGSLLVIQARQAAEAFGLLAFTLGTALWLAGHRPTPAQARRWALAFTLGVAAYAVIARLMQNSPPAAHPGGEVHFGFFPNRNHSATLLAMGAICGLGNVLQAMRDKRFPGLAVALGGTGVCLWAVAAWSVSRGGVVLVALGCLAWLPMLGARYLGKHGLRALALIGLAATGLFFIADTAVKARLATTVEKASLAINPPNTAPAELGKPELDSARDLDFRIPTALDTLGLIRDFKWTGIGAGQYQYVFPQYRKLTAVVNDADNYHPESDWLWLAAETGLPATLALAALVMLALRKSLRDILHGRDRAVRSACLVAALLVPLHGLFDVPGHRITLALSAALLFALSLRAPPADSPQTPPRAWPFRLAGLAILAAAAGLIRAQWGGGPPPAVVAGQLACAEALSLYHKDQALQRQAAASTAASAAGAYQPSPEADLLERALGGLQQAQAKVPLLRNLYHLQGFLALQFDDKNPLAQQAFAIERALDPTWVAAPMQQASAWLTIDPQQALTLWHEALQRARQLDRLRAGPPAAETQTRDAILQQVRGKPALEQLWQQHSGEFR